MPRIRVVIADHPTMVREGIHELLAREDDLEIAAEADDEAQAERLVTELRPDILLLDSSLLISGPTLQTIREKSPQTKILILIKGLLGEGVLEYIKAGVRGVISKQERGAALLKAIRTVVAGELWLGRKMMERTIEALLAFASVEHPQGRLCRLTQQELRIAKLVAQGWDNKEIAGTLCRSEKTIKNHLTTIFRKVGCRNRTQLAALLLQQSSPVSEKLL
jgi:Response regulator containing a CheY-like receiver domain and an HTH DNA-binding domain